MSTRVGLISDTHGLMRPAAIHALQSSDLIIHAGDVGSEEVIRALRELAPVVAVRGNMDRGPWAERLRLLETVEIEQVHLLVLHDIGKLDLRVKKESFQVVVSGHSHHPSIRDDDSIMFLNPGSAGPRRFSLPVTVMMLEVDGETIDAQLIDLE